MKGLALGHVVGYTFAAIVSGAGAPPPDGRDWRGAGWPTGCVRIGVAAAATGGAAWGAARLVGDAPRGPRPSLEQCVQVTAGVAAGLMIFVVSVVLLRVEEFGLVKRFVLARIRR